MEVSARINSILSDDTAFYAILMVLVALTAYGLGKHSSVPPPSEQSTANVVLQERSRDVQPAAETTERANQSPEGTSEVALVASKNGSKYHFLWCPSAGRINEENKIFFDSFAAARAAGYEPAANCDGLE